MNVVNVVGPFSLFYKLLMDGWIGVFCLWDERGEREKGCVCVHPLVSPPPPGLREGKMMG